MISKPQFTDVCGDRFRRIKRTLQISKT